MIWQAIAELDRLRFLVRKGNPEAYLILNMIKQTPKKMVPGMIPIAALIALSREIVEILF